jgi:hypothetical protein
MRARSPLTLVGIFVALLTSVAAQAEADPETPTAADGAKRVGDTRPHGELSLTVHSPAPGSVVELPGHSAKVRGTAAAVTTTTTTGDGPTAYDVMIAIDVSQSTKVASGADVDQDGEVGEIGAIDYPDDAWSTDPDDTILAAEVKAVRALLESVNSKHVRVGLVTFSGEVDPTTGRQVSPGQSDAKLELPLTHDYDSVRRSLDDVLARTPHGATNFAAGIWLAITELAGFADAMSTPRPAANKMILFLTDGFPTFPAGQATVSDPGDLGAAVSAARAAQAAGIRINTYALGTTAVTRPIAATEVARVTLGTFTPVVEPGAIVATLQAVSFANIEDVGVLNLTTRKSAPDVRLNPDGSFVAFVPVREGPNRVLVKAVAFDGSQADLEIEFTVQVTESNDSTRPRDSTQ